MGNKTSNATSNNQLSSVQNQLYIEPGQAGLQQPVVRLPAMAIPPPTSQVTLHANVPSFQPRSHIPMIQTGCLSQQEQRYQPPFPSSQMNSVPPNLDVLSTPQELRFNQRNFPPLSQTSETNY